jgi:hypothetical protein
MTGSWKHDTEYLALTSWATASFSRRNLLHEVGKLHSMPSNSMDQIRASESNSSLSGQ